MDTDKHFSNVNISMGFRHLKDSIKTVLEMATGSKC